MTLTDWLRRPPLHDPTASAYKEWFHFNLFDHTSGGVGLINASLHGDPSDPRAVGVGSILFHDPDSGWITHTEIRPLADARLGRSSIALRDVALAVGPDGTVVVSAAAPGQLRARISARPAVDAVVVDRPVPLGSGWLSWLVVPRLNLDGTLVTGDRSVDLAKASGYFDHNWGRWHWGDDMGWTWGAFLAADHGPVVVLSSPTDRSHREQAPSLLVLAHGARRRFAGQTLEVGLLGGRSSPLKRVPGATAAMHSDRARPILPQRVSIRADDGFDRVELDFDVRAAAQIVTADPAAAGSGFIHELVGSFRLNGSVASRAVDATGLGVFEYVD